VRAHTLNNREVLLPMHCVTREAIVSITGTIEITTEGTIRLGMGIDSATIMEFFRKRLTSQKNEMLSKGIEELRFFTEKLIGLITKFLTNY